MNHPVILQLNLKCQELHLYLLWIMRCAGKSFQILLGPQYYVWWSVVNP
jgi:hypothetical protein